LIRQVFFPGLAGASGKEFTAGQARGPGPVVAFTTGDPEVSRRIVEAGACSRSRQLRLGGSSISLPCRMSHREHPASCAAARSAATVRLSIGIEDVDTSSPI